MREYMVQVNPRRNNVANSLLISQQVIILHQLQSESNKSMISSEISLIRTLYKEQYNDSMQLNHLMISLSARTLSDST